MKQIVLPSTALCYYLAKKKQKFQAGSQYTILSQFFLKLVFKTIFYEMNDRPFSYVPIADNEVLHIQK